MKWFGFPEKERPPAVLDTPFAEVEVPTGLTCLYCSRYFLAEDRGFIFITDEPIHQACLLEMVLGRGWRRDFPMLSDEVP